MFPYLPVAAIHLPLWPAWTTAVWNAQAPCCTSYSAFEEEFKRVFQHPLSGRQVSKQLQRFAREPTVQHNMPSNLVNLPRATGWNDEALIVCFENGLSEELKEELVTRDPVYSLERLIDQVILLDNRLRQRWIPRPNTHSPKSFRQPFTSVSVPLESPELMQLGRTRLSPGCHFCLYSGLQGWRKTPSPEQEGESCLGSNPVSLSKEHWLVPAGHSREQGQATPVAGLSGFWGRRKFNGHCHALPSSSAC